MKKKVRITKRILSLGLVFLLSINSFAAIIADNDGSAFITKAEFDSLRNNFQSQIDNYNQSIDSKIDGAIAAYLEGLQIVTEEILPNIVENYDKIMWVYDWKLYGSYKHFSCANNTAVDVNKTNVWFTPPAEKRVAARGNQWNFTTWGCSWGPIPIGIQFAFTPSSNKYILDGGMGATGHNFAIQLKSSDKTTVDNTTPFVNVRGMNNWFYCYGVSNSTSNGDMNWDYGFAPTGALSSYTDTAADAILSWKATLKRGDGSSDTASCYLRSSNTNFPTTYGTYSAFNTTAYDLAKVNDGGDTYSTLSFFKSNGGVTYVKLNNSYTTHLTNLANYMMFGRDISSIVNTYIYRKESAYYGNQCYEVDNTSNVTGSAKISTVYGNSPKTNFNTSHAVTASGTTTHTFKIPMMPQKKIAGLSSGLVKANEKNLTYGQGIPIVEKLNRKGTIKVKLHWDVAGILGGSITDKKIKIDLKDQDFSTTSGNYKKAKIDNQSGTEVEIKGKLFDSTAQTTTLYINGNEGDNIWLRMLPNATDDGRYAKISLLEVTLLQEK